MSLHELARFNGAHHQALETLGARALQRGDAYAAYRMADRRCRIRPYPEAHCFVLRAEALHRMNEPAAAIGDLETALEIAPDDLAANRRMLAWASGHQQVSAAKALIRRERNIRVLRQAAATLAENGETRLANLQLREGSIEGWAAWRGGEPALISITDGKGRTEIVVAPAPDHPLSAVFGSAAAFKLSRPAPREHQTITLTANGATLASVRTAGAACARSPDPSVDRARPARVTIIVPVYADIEATEACIDSLVGQLDAGRGIQAIFVDDASPARHMAALLDSTARHAGVRVLTNAGNLGFVGAVNRALREVEAGDVVLLNADTIVPPGFVERLTEAARSAPDIGTVTPLSNNGEFTSFPLANQSNPLPSAADIAALDRIAAEVNAGRVIDIPNGIGFCLYITRACLDAVGGLSESYQRGYLEDVDFCLRARRSGFRNVCAPFIFVGHAGSRSFGIHKRALVVGNLEVIEQRFPSYRGECADFVLADPLKPARRAIEAAMPPLLPGATLLVSAGGAVAEIAQERAGQLLSDDTAVLLLTIFYRAGRIVASLRDAGGGVPQSLDFDMSAEPAALLRVLEQAKLARMELFDIARIPRPIIAALMGLPVPHDVFVAHRELGLTRAADPVGHHAAFCDVIIASADRVLVPDAQAEAFAGTDLTRRATVRLPSLRSTPTAGSRPAECVANRIGLVTVGRGAEQQQLIRELIAGLRTASPGSHIVVIGGTQDDAELLRSADVFVTGPVDATELNDVFRYYQLGRAVLCLPRPLFGHPLTGAVMNSAVPVAYADWSRGRAGARDGDLPLDPGLPMPTMVERLARWAQDGPPR